MGKINAKRTNDDYPISFKCNNYLREYYSNYYCYSVFFFCSGFFDRLYDVVAQF